MKDLAPAPPQRLMGRRCKTLAPVAGTLLQPRYSTEEETRALIGSNQRQQHHYNHHVKPLQPGQAITAWTEDMEPWHLPGKGWPAKLRSESWRVYLQAQPPSADSLK